VRISNKCARQRRAEFRALNDILLIFDPFRVILQCKNVKSDYDIVIRSIAGKANLLSTSFYCFKGANGLVVPPRYVNFCCRNLPKASLSTKEKI